MSAESQILALAAKTAQAILAPMADPDGGGEFTLAGLTGTWVAVIEEDPNMLLPTPNGYEKVYGLRLAADRSQFTTAQETTLAGLAATRARLTAKGKAWNLTSATPQANHFNLVAVIA